MWNDLVQVGVPQSDGITTSELFCQWQKLTPKQKKKKKKFPSTPSQGKALPGKCQNSRKEGLVVPPKLSTL